MTIQERNVEILNFIKEHPINLGTPNCYKEVCDKFFVNTDVIRGILRRNPNLKVIHVFINCE
jgi:hypothetical protein